MTFSLVDREIIAVYLLLTADESKLDKTLAALAARIERSLYDRLSIEQFEHLRELYAGNANLFRD